jgi:hypothetical protein
MCRTLAMSFFVGRGRRLVAPLLLILCFMTELRGRERNDLSNSSDGYVHAEVLSVGCWLRWMWWQGRV